VYTTFKTPITCLLRQNNSSTKTMRFPGKLPIISNGPFHKDMWRRHGDLPDTSYRAALWGSFKDDARSWVAIAVFASAEVNRTLDKNISFTLATYHAELNEFASHWHHLLQYIYAIGINDIRLSLRKSIKQLDVLVGTYADFGDGSQLTWSQRYRNIFEPTIGFATTCALYLNHLGYCRRLVLGLNKELIKFPGDWNLDAATSSGLDWVSRTQEGLKVAEKEVSQVYDEVEKMREMVTGPTLTRPS